MEEKRKKYHRGRRKKKTKKQIASQVISTIVLVVALVVFAISAFKLYEIFHGYHEGESEYEELEELAIINKGKEERFQVDFDALKEIKKDVVGWIRFEEPAVISYPVVQGRDNAEYLYKTFKGFENTVGSIFVNA